MNFQGKGRINIPIKRLRPFFTTETLLWICGFGAILLFGTWGVIGFIAIP
jgi:hypothetical protein